MVCKSDLNERLQAFNAIRSWLVQDAFFKNRELSPFAMELSLGVCRRYLRLQHALKKNVRKMPGLEIQILIEMGLYQLFYMDSVPEYAALSETVKTARLAGVGENGVKLITGVLRSIQKNGLPELPPQNVFRISLEYSVPEWIVRRWLDEGGTNYAEKRAKETLLSPIQWIRINTKKTNLKFICEKLQIENKPYEERFLKVPPQLKISQLLQTDLFTKGFFSFQSPAAAKIVSLLNVSPEMSVWDACAAPGGKTALLAEMDINCKITASDVSETRMEKMKDLFSRLNLEEITTQVIDVLDHSFDSKFDRILLDVPCSNLGVVSRRPEALYRIKPEDLETLAKMQFHLLESASKALKPGGILVYATCSPEPIETVRVIARFLKKHSHFSAIGETIFTGDSEPGGDRFFAQALMRK